MTMPAYIDLSGKRFGSLLVLCDNGRDRHGAVLWRCACDCGNTSLIRGSSLTGGRSASCGCGVKKAARLPRKHGMTHTALYRCWQAMKRRCTNPKDTEWRNYGGRGIKVCERWSDSFTAFLADMNVGYFEGAEIDRKDTNGEYGPGNCRWLSHKSQQRNKRSNRLITINGESKTLVEWSEATGIKANTILTRLRRGWPKSRLLEIANAD